MTMYRFVRWLTGEEADESEASGERTIQRDAREASQDPVENDAEAYGVTVEQVQVEPGTHYWKVTRVHHLDRDENNGQHHIFFEALTPEGRRAQGQRARVSWEGGEHTLPLDKPQNEPAGNFPMWKWQVCTAEMLGMPSDRVHGLGTNHPDEPYPDGRPSGNTLFHHSFLVEFQQVTAEAEEVATGSIAGRVQNAREGLTAQLQKDDQTLAHAPVAAAADGTGTFEFEEIEFGEIEEGIYRVLLDGQIQDVPVSPGETSDVTFVLDQHDSVLEGTVRNGGGMRLHLIREGEVIAEGRLGQSGAFRLRNLGPGTYFVQVLRDGAAEALVRGGPYELDGTSTRRVELLAGGDASGSANVPGSPFDRYLLFGHPDSGTTRAQLTVLAPLLAGQRLAFGFDFREAAHARRVTVIGDGDAVPESSLIFLASRGVRVERLTGTPQEILSQLKSDG